MSPTQPTEHDLNARLSRQAERFDRLGGAELGLGQVLDRAGEIKRGRRMRASIVMAASVLAIAVPTALVASDRSRPEEPTPAPPSVRDVSPLTIDGLDAGDAPKIAYVQSGTVHLHDGSTVHPSGGQPVTVAEYAGGVVLGLRDEGGAVTARKLDDNDSWPMEGGFAVSGDDQLVAFVQPDGTPVVVSSSGTGDDKAAYSLPRVQRGSGFDAVAVNGQGCRATVELPCRVWVTSHGASPETWTSTAHDVADKVTGGFVTVTDVDTTDTLVVGITKVNEDLTTCSAVEPSTGSTPLWTTCDHRLRAFSPDDERLLAFGSIGDGLGDSQLAILDARTGKVELDLRTTEQAFITQTAWEDDTHVLATVFEHGAWAVLRIGLDGSREYAVAPVQGEDLDSPFVLASR